MRLYLSYFVGVIVCLLLSCTDSGQKASADNLPKSIKDTVCAEETPTPIEKIDSKIVQSIKDQGLVNVADIDSSIIIDIKYATKDNFTGKILYDELNEAYLQPMAAEKLKEAQRLLKQHNPELSLLVYDAARPLFIQRIMYDAVKNTKYHLYVANPSRTSLHNYGIAVDLTIYDKKNKKPLDMGTPFDYFGKEAGIYREEEFVEKKLLTQSQVDNRKLLRNVMISAGFQSIRGEWWHFNACSLSEAKQRFSVIE